jgi:hypothetical protein
MKRTKIQAVLDADEEVKEWYLLLVIVAVNMLDEEREAELVGEPEHLLISGELLVFGGRLAGVGQVATVVSMTLLGRGAEGDILCK